MVSHTDNGGVPSRTATMLLLRTSQDTTCLLVRVKSARAQHITRRAGQNEMRLQSLS